MFVYHHGYSWMFVQQGCVDALCAFRRLWQIGRLRKAAARVPMKTGLLLAGQLDRLLASCTASLPFTAIPAGDLPPAPEPDCLMPKGPLGWRRRPRETPGEPRRTFKRYTLESKIHVQIGIFGELVSEPFRGILQPLHLATDSPAKKVRFCAEQILQNQDQSAPTANQ